MRRALLVTLVAVLTVTAAAGEPPRPRRLTILHFNDIHGHLEPWRADTASAATVGGIARMAALVERIRRENRASGRATLLLEAGDVFQGPPMSGVFRGEADVEAFNVMGVDAMAFGNHEFDFGRDALDRFRRRARFPVLGANIYTTDGRPFAVGTTVLEPSPGFRVGLIGLTTDDAPSTTFPSNVAGLAFDDPIATARHAVPVLERECDLVVAVTHIGLGVDRRLAREVPGVGVVVGGHSHIALTAPEVVSGTPIVQAGDFGRFLGRIDLVVSGGRATIEHAELIPIVDGMPESARVRAVVGRYAALLHDRLSEVVGRSNVLLDGDRTNIRSRETTLGNYLTDLVRAATHADVALLNGGSSRASIGAGAVTYGDVLTALPFGNTIVVVDVPGGALRAALDRSASLDPADQPGGFLQVSGVRYVVEGGRAVDVRVGDAPLDDARSYSVAIPDFLFAGGDGFTMFAADAARHVDTGLVLNNLVLDSLRSGTVADPRVEGRIVRR